MITTPQLQEGNEKMKAQKEIKSTEEENQEEGEEKEYFLPDGKEICDIML